jgi:hypothetical protein
MRMCVAHLIHIHTVSWTGNMKTPVSIFLNTYKFEVSVQTKEKEKKR